MILLGLVSAVLHYMQKMCRLVFSICINVDQMQFHVLRFAYGLVFTESIFLYSAFPWISPRFDLPTFCLMLISSRSASHKIDIL